MSRSYGCQGDRQPFLVERDGVKTYTPLYTEIAGDTTHWSTCLPTCLNTLKSTH